MQVSGCRPDHETQVALAGVNGVRHKQVVDHLLLPVLLGPLLPGQAVIEACAYSIQYIAYVFQHISVVRIGRRCISHTLNIAVNKEHATSQTMSQFASKRLLHDLSHEFKDSSLNLH